MPSLFNRRSRSMSTPRPAPTSSAHLAATQAFLASQSSQANFSTSAAAAALRTMSPPPTSVDQVQTKRMLNKQPSNASITNSPRGRSTGTVQRRPSAGSMTERSFRSPSPGGQSATTGPTGNGVGAPPVPPLPNSYKTDGLPPIPQKSHRRSASMDTPPRLSSPPLSKPGRRGPSINQSPNVSSAATTAARRSANVPPPNELQRSDSQDSRNSINFSYPRGSRPTSPPPRSPLASNVDASPVTSAGTSRNGISESESARIQHELYQIAAKPVKKKPKKVDRSLAEGSHLQSGTMGARPTVHPLEPLPDDYIPPASEQPVKKPKKKAALTGQSSHFPDSQDDVDYERTGHDSDAIADDTADKRAQRAAGVLGKQPSVVREDWEGEQEGQQSSPLEAATSEPVGGSSREPKAPIQSKKKLPEANMSRKIDEPVVSTKSTSSVHDQITVGSPQTNEITKSYLGTTTETSAGRGVSISPSRSTRFSDRLASDLSVGRKHEPLGRSVSPAKSALKHSHGASDSSPLDPRFPGRRGSSVTPSEASDASADGFSGRRRPSARVSFDAPSDTRTTNSERRVSKDNGNRNRLGRSSDLTDEEDNQTVEEGMKPRPALPSFGSVRRGNRSASPNGRLEDSAATLPVSNQSATSSETSSIADPPTMNTSISSDNALGGMLYRQSLENASSRSNNERASRSATAAADRAGYNSDSESASSDEDDRPFNAAQIASQKLGRTLGSDQKQPSKDTIPMIAVQPATPGLDELHHGDEWAVNVPGGFSSAGTTSHTPSQPTASKQTSSSTPVKEPSGLGLSSSNQDYSPARETSANASPQQLTTITEEDSDASSLYSDAAEDLSDLEGDGYGSINAIMESPMVRSPPETPLAAVSQTRPGDGQRTASWDDTQAHWSGLAQQVKKKQQADSIPKTTTISSATYAKVEPPTKVQVVKQPTSKVSKPAPRMMPVEMKTLRTGSDMSQSSTSSYVNTKRASAPKQQGHLRSSMRGAPEPVAPATQRPASYAGAPSGPPSAARAALQKKHIPPAPAPKAPIRRFSNDSDSDSSFRRARRNRKATEGTYTMKRSMRSGAGPQTSQPAASSRTDIRASSPPAQSRPTSALGAKTMRTSMRSSMDMGTPTLRSQPEKRSSSLFSRNRTAKSPPRPSTATTVLPSTLKSRLADSDDEDDKRPQQFKSRFAESSDEDEPKSFRPVRGIPRKKDDVESTDLDDSSDEDKKKKKAAPVKKLAIVSPPPEQEVLSPPSSPGGTKKRGLWSRLRGKKKDEEEVERPIAYQTIAERENIKTEVISGKGASNNAAALGFSSTEERDAMIEQTRIMLETSRDRTQSPARRPGSPPVRLQRRITPQRVLSDSWASSKMPAPIEDRPQTSDGLDEVSRPALGSRQPTGASQAVNGNGVAYGKSGKKKKFGFLRKAFGLSD